MMAVLRINCMAVSLSVIDGATVIESPVWGPILVITCAITVNVLVRLQTTAAGEVPRLLASAVAVSAGVSALYALSYAVMSRLVRRHPRAQMDKRGLKLGRLLNEGGLNPYRRIL